MKDIADIPQAPLRPPETVMRLRRMGAMFPTRLSFLRSLTRDLAADHVRISRPVWEIDDKGVGHAVYSLRFGGHVYSLVAIAQDLAPEDRTDRVIATAWDSTYVLYDGVPDAEALARICATAPKQEAARFTERELVLSRANKSVRLFSHIVECLRQGRQPEAEEIKAVGYLMRTTAVYGNGKFGIADRAVFAGRPYMGGPFRAEMLTVYLIRLFTHDLVAHLGGRALAPELRRHLGIGNATGLGMAPFLVNHPVLLNNWMAARETALARVCAVEDLAPAVVDQLAALHGRAAQHLDEWQVPDADAQARIDQLRLEWFAAGELLTPDRLQGAQPLARVLSDLSHGSEDVQELMVALLLEPFGDLIDGLETCMADPFGAHPAGFRDTGEVAAALRRHFSWALDIDFAPKAAQAQFWYVSASKQEPRLGDRYAEAGAELESALDIARRIRALADELPAVPEPLASFAARHPEHLLALSRVGVASRYPYSEIHDNLIAETCLPVDMLRCKLSFFGASKFDPKSDRWTRITLCQGAPLPEDLSTGADDWWLPVFGA